MFDRIFKIATAGLDPVTQYLMKLAAFETANTIRWQCVLFMGVGGSGKGWVKDNKYLKHLDFREIDPDEIKKLHPDYDPEKPMYTHTWSSDSADAIFKKYVTDGTGSPILVDGTGKTYENMKEKAVLARKHGYKVYIVYVYVPPEVSLYRNRLRSRFVNESLLLDQIAGVENTLKRLKKDSSFYDKLKVINNYSESDVNRALTALKQNPPPISRRKNYTPVPKKDKKIEDVSIFEKTFRDMHKKNISDSLIPVENEETRARIKKLVDEKFNNEIALSPRATKVLHELLIRIIRH